MRGKQNSSGPSWVDPDDAPAWSEDAFERAEIAVGDTVVRPASGTVSRRGRPRLENPKRLVTLRLDGDVLDRLREGGPGWQSRVNEILRKAVKA